MDGGDVSVSTTQSINFVVRDILGQVFYEDVIEDFSHISFILGLELDSNELILTLGLLKSCSAVLNVLEAHEAVAAGLVVLVDGDFAGLDPAEVFVFLLKLLRSCILVNFSDENVLLLELWEVYSKEVIVEWESAAVLFFVLEVAHLILHLFEVLLFFDSDTSGVERFVYFSADLGLLDFNAGQTLDDGGKLDGGELGLGQVVKVNYVVLTHVGNDCGLHLFFCFFCFYVWSVVARRNLLITVVLIKSDTPN